MIIERGIQVTVFSNTLAGGLATAFVTLVGTFETDPSIGIVRVNLTVFPDSKAPRVIQNMRVYVNRSDGGGDDGDFNGFAFLVDDV